MRVRGSPSVSTNSSSGINDYRLPAISGGDDQSSLIMNNQRLNLINTIEHIKPGDSTMARRYAYCATAPPPSLTRSSPPQVSDVRLSPPPPPPSLRCTCPLASPLPSTSSGRGWAGALITGRVTRLARLGPVCLYAQLSRSRQSTQDRRS